MCTCISACVVCLENEHLNKVAGKDPGIDRLYTNSGNTGTSIVVQSVIATSHVEENVLNRQRTGMIDKTAVRRKRNRTLSNETVSSSDDTDTEAAKRREIIRQKLSLKKHKKLRKKSSESSGNSVEIVKSASNSVESWKSDFDNHGNSQENHAFEKYTRVHSDVYVEEGSNSSGKSSLLQKVLTKNTLENETVELYGLQHKPSGELMLHGNSDDNGHIQGIRSSSRERKLPKRFQKESPEDSKKGQSLRRRRKSVSSVTGAKTVDVKKVVVKPQLQSSTLKAKRITQQSDASIMTVRSNHVLGSSLHASIPNEMQGEGRQKFTKMRGKLPEGGVAILKSWLFDHRNHPYPSEVDKDILSKASDLRVKQVGDWFINARRRLLPLMKGATEETYSAFAKRIKMQKQCQRNEKEHKHYNSDVESLFSTASDTDLYSLDGDSTVTASDNEADDDTNDEGSSMQEMWSIFRGKDIGESDKKESSESSSTDKKLQKDGGGNVENYSLGGSEELLQVEIIRESDYVRELEQMGMNGMV